MAVLHFFLVNYILICIIFSLYLCLFIYQWEIPFHFKYRGPTFNRPEQIDSSTNVEFVHSQYSCTVLRIKCLSYSKKSAILCGLYFLLGTFLIGPFLCCHLLYLIIYLCQNMYRLCKEYLDGTTPNEIKF